MERRRLSCVRCGKIAVYLVRASGEPLCQRCLGRSLIKSVRRVLGRYSRLDPGLSIVVVEPLINKFPLCSSLMILVKAIKSHRNRLIIVGYGGGEKCSIDSHIERVVGLDVKRVMDFCAQHRDPYDRVVCVYKAEYLIGSIIAEKLGVGTVFLIRPRDLCSLIGVMGIAALNLSLAVEAMPSRTTYSGINVINPFYGVSSQDLAVYSHLLGLIEEHASCHPQISLEDLPGYLDIQSIYAHSSEMIYSSTESIKEIFNKTSEARCRLCGALAESNGYCRICLSLFPLLKELLNFA